MSLRGVKVTGREVKVAPSVVGSMRWEYRSLRLLLGGALVEYGSRLRRLHQLPDQETDAQDQQQDPDRL